mmetsp:Transcript_5794/g.15452  ORF Transcript_5794/g.15452 Transcript_5794/m.15452 type:complete len:122 (-) Transcript_5794:567-932(-)
MTAAITPDTDHPMKSTAAQTVNFVSSPGRARYSRASVKATVSKASSSMAIFLAPDEKKLDPKPIKSTQKLVARPANIQRRLSADNSEAIVASSALKQARVMFGNATTTPKEGPQHSPTIIN